MKLPRPLDPVEIRVLGSLLEKEQTTPDAYPLSVNALLSACTQRSNRDPVMELHAADVEAALDRLHEDVLVWPVEGARVERWRHNVDRRWELAPATKAVVTVLLLRGAQTPGELRARTERMRPFATTAEVERLLEALAAEDEPLVSQLERRPGQKESRWTHLVAGPRDESVAAPSRPAVAVDTGPSLRDRVAELETRVARLEEALARIEGQ
jgi:uncharacterized protein YceH (UPF0502 family)